MVYFKKGVSTFLILLYFVFLAAANSPSITVNNLADDIVSQFNQLVEYNKHNDLNGESYKNRYVLNYKSGQSFDAAISGVDYIQSHTFINEDWNFNWPDENNNDIYDIEEDLCDFNGNVDGKNIFNIRKYAIIFGYHPDANRTLLTADLPSQSAIVNYMSNTNASVNKDLFLNVELLIETKIRNDFNGSALDGAEEKVITISNYFYKKKRPFSSEIEHFTRTRTFYIQSSTLTASLYNQYITFCNSITGPLAERPYTGTMYKRVRGFIDFFENPNSFNLDYNPCDLGFIHAITNQVKQCYCDDNAPLEQKEFLTYVCTFIDNNHFYTTGGPILNSNLGSATFDCDIPTTSWINTIVPEFTLYNNSNPGSNGLEWVLQNKLIDPILSNTLKANLLYYYVNASIVDLRNLSPSERHKLIAIAKHHFPNGTSTIYTDNTQVTMTKMISQTIFTALESDVPQIETFLTKLKDDPGLMEWMFHEVCGNTWIDFNNEHDEHQVISSINKIVEKINGGAPDQQFMDQIELYLTDWGEGGVIWKPTPWWWNFAGHYQYDNISVSADATCTFRQRYINAGNAQTYFTDTIWNVADPFLEIPVGGGKDVTWATDCHNGENAVIGCGKIVRVPAFSLAWYMDKMNAGQSFDALVTAAEIITIPIGGAQFSALMKVAGTASKVLRARRALYGFSLAASITDLTLPGLSGFVSENLLGVSGVRANALVQQIKKVTGIFAAIGGIAEISDLFIGLSKYWRVSKALGNTGSEVNKILDDVANMLVNYPEYTSKISLRLGANTAVVDKILSLSVETGDVTVNVANAKKIASLIGAIKQSDEILAAFNATPELIDFIKATLNSADVDIHKIMIQLDEVQYLKLLNDLKAGGMVSDFTNNVDLLKGWKILDKAGTALSSNKIAVEKITFLKSKGLSDLQLFNIGQLDDIKCINIADNLAKRIAPPVPQSVLDELDLLVSTAKSMESYDPNVLNKLEDLTLNANFKNPVDLNSNLAAGLSNMQNPQGASLGFITELDEALRGLLDGETIALGKFNTFNNELDVVSESGQWLKEVKRVESAATNKFNARLKDIGKKFNTDTKLNLGQRDFYRNNGGLKGVVEIGDMANPIYGETFIQVQTRIQNIINDINVPSYIREGLQYSESISVIRGADRLHFVKGIHYQ